jgi:hypothetical protein
MYKVTIVLNLHESPPDLSGMMEVMRNAARANGLHISSMHVIESIIDGEDLTP